MISLLTIPVGNKLYNIVFLFEPISVNPTSFKLCIVVVKCVKKSRETGGLSYLSLFKVLSLRSLG